MYIVDNKSNLALNFRSDLFFAQRNKYGKDYGKMAEIKQYLSSNKEIENLYLRFFFTNELSI